MTVLAVALAATARAQTKLLRFPNVHGDTVVFSYAGDLWTASTAGGRATRLTSHPGIEIFAKFSPDGKWIAFTGQYDGDEQVYVIPATGGVPRQLTFYPARATHAPRHGYDNLVYGWTPDGKSVVFRSMRDADGITEEGRLYTVPLAGGNATTLPMPNSGAGDFAPDGKRLVYSPLFRDFRTWKHYEGGWAQDLYIYDLASNDAELIAHSVRTERDPMWIGNTIYFLSDRDGRLNLYSLDVAGKALAKLTDEGKFDARWATSDHDHQIVFEVDGELHLYDTATRRERALKIEVPTDGATVRPQHYAVDKFIEDYGLSPKGERALFVARGDVFTAPIEHGPTRNLTNSSRFHERWARWSPDGGKIAYISDRSGDDQVWVIPQDGFGPAQQLTTDHQGMLYQPEWSPDGARIAVSDKDGAVFVLTLADKKFVKVAQDERGQVRDYAWSPDGQFLAFSLAGLANDNRSLWMWCAADGKTQHVTPGVFSEHDPAWDPEGKVLYYLSEREYAPLVSADWNYALTRNTGVFALTLTKEGPSAFPPQSDEVNAEAADKPAGGDKADKVADKSDDKADKKAKAEKKPVRVDFAGLADRVARVAIDAENIADLAVTKSALLWRERGGFFYGRDSWEKGKLVIYDLKERESSTLAEDVRGWVISADGNKVLVRHAESFELYDAKPKAKDKKVVSTKGLYVDRVPSEEFAEIFDEVWRRYRDFFYSTNMHGYDWAAIGDEYRPWVQWVGHRSDLNHLIGEMISELNVGHAYVQGGDFQTPERPKVALAGARFALDEKAGRYKIATIFRGDNSEERYRSPLTEPGVNVSVGDYVLAIDGTELTAKDDPFRLLAHKTDPVTLTVNSTPSMAGSRRVTYRPIASEASLVYLQTVNANREKVAKATGGKVGYLHIPDMGEDGIAEFIKWFYPQIRAQGMVVDVRSNGGGNVSQWIIERLGRKLLGTRFGRKPVAGTYPDVVFYGQKVCLLNETSASDGDIFPYMFRQAGLGPLIGKRSWGGVVGIDDNGPLIDGGQIFVPQEGTNDASGAWVIEGHGVDPDIVVENDPKAVIAGHDPQLERGIEEVTKLMAAKPLVLPARPADPVKNK
jgi:tricorn protease